MTSGELSGERVMEMNAQARALVDDFVAMGAPLSDIATIACMAAGICVAREGGLNPRLSVAFSEVIHTAYKLERSEINDDKN